MNRTTARTVLPLSALALVTITGTGLLFAGPLDPPAGAVKSSYKTLSEVEPRIAINPINTPGDTNSLFRIDKPGSYYMTGNITGVVGKHGIEIVASGVTIDLNGFDLAGVPAMGAFDGISATAAALTNIAVRNGSVRDWGGDGVDLGTSGAVNGRVESLRVAGNVGRGIYAGSGSSITACSISDNADIGLSTSSACVITNCTVSGNSSYGVFTSTGCTIAGCSVDTNGGSGISAGNGSTVTGCSAYNNNVYGILAGTGCSISECTVAFNDSSGISASTGCTVKNCTARGNVVDGILCASACMISGNTCNLNGNGGDGAGIHATNADNRIEGNNCTGANRGIDVDAAGNIILRNTCSGNTINWNIAGNNIVGPILDRTAPASAAISGNSAPDSTGSTHPNANFTY